MYNMPTLCVCVCVCVCVTKYQTMFHLMVHASLVVPHMIHYDTNTMIEEEEYHESDMLVLL